MKKAVYILFFICVLLETGCFNYRDINRLFFTTAGIVDVGDNGDIIAYSENFKAYRGQGEKNGTEIRLVFRGKGKSLLDAYSEIVRTASYEINYTQIKALIYTERAARYGLDNFVDAADRDQKTTLRLFVFIYDGDPQELVDLKIPDEQFLGLFLDNLMVSQGRIANIVQLRFDEFLNRRNIGSRVNVVPIIRKVSEGSGDRIEVSGGAVIKDDRMVGRLSPEEVVPYNMIINEADTGILVCPHPQHKNKYVSYKILRNKTKILLDYDGKKVRLKKNIFARLTLVESMGSLDLTNDSIREKMKEDAEEKLEKGCMDLFNKFKEKDIDIYNVQKIFEEKYPKEKVEDVLAITEVETNCKVHIEGSNDTTNFR
jgi:Ger(x)C family germination protein